MVWVAIGTVRVLIDSMKIKINVICQIMTIQSGRVGSTKERLISFVLILIPQVHPYYRVQPALLESVQSMVEDLVLRAAFWGPRKGGENYFRLGRVALWVTCAPRTARFPRLWFS